MKEIKYQQKYVRQLVDMTIDQKRGDWYMFHKIKKTSPTTPLPERGE